MSLGPYEFGRVYLGDCAELMRALPERSVQMMFTDPPYGHNNNNGDLAHRREAALGVLPAGAAAPLGRPILNDGRKAADDALDAMLREASRVLERDCCCCCGGGGGGPTPQFARWSLRLDEKPWSFFHAVVWDKGGLGMGWRYRRNYEMVLVAHLRGGRLRWAWEGSGTETANVVRLGKILPASHQHPTQKPVELVEHFLRLHTYPDDIVLDPFAGSGTTGVACKRLGRRFIGFELDPQWVTLANARLGDTSASRRRVSRPPRKPRVPVSARPLTKAERRRLTRENARALFPSVALHRYEETCCELEAQLAALRGEHVA